jgi:hypothetical protein
VAIGLLVALAVIFGGGYLMLRSYLHGDGFREFLSREVSRSAKVKGEFSTFRWDGLATDTEKFSATGDGPLASVTAEGLHTEVGFGGVTRGVWELKGSSVSRLDVAYDATRREPEISAPPEEKVPVTKKERPRPWYPRDVEIGGVDVREMNVSAVSKNDGQFSATGMIVHVDAEKTKGSYRADVRGGRVKLPGDFFPEIALDQVRARFQDGSLFVTSAKASLWETGKIDLSGEWDSKAKTYAAEGSARGIACEHLLSESWSKRVTGEVSSTFAVDAASGEPVAKGSLVIDHAVLTALPVLDALAAYADTRRFRVLTLNEAHADWQWAHGETTLSNIVLSSDGLVRLEGNLVIRDKRLEGNFRLGLAPGTLASIPGAETDVFAPGEKGLLWTTLRISGKIDHPKEDLTDRLIAAAGLRMFEDLPGSGEKALKFSRSLLGDSPEDALSRGGEVIEKTQDFVKEARDLLKDNEGLLDGILGGRRSKEDRKKHE